MKNPGASAGVHSVSFREGGAYATLAARCFSNRLRSFGSR